MQQQVWQAMRICSITPVAGAIELRVYETDHSAASIGLSRAASLKIASTETAPSVASLMRLARSYDGRRSPLKISDRWEGRHFTKSAKADCLMPCDSIQEPKECGVVMPELCHWQTHQSSAKLCYQKMDLAESPVTIGTMARALKKVKLKAVGVKPKSKPDPIKLFVGEWFHNAGIKQSDAADALGIGEAYMSTIVNGRKKNGKPANPSYSLLLILSNWLGCTVNDLAMPPPPKEEFERVRSRLPGQQVIAQVLANRKQH